MVGCIQVPSKPFAVIICIMVANVLNQESKLATDVIILSVAAAAKLDIPDLWVAFWNW